MQTTISLKTGKTHRLPPRSLLGRLSFLRTCEELGWLFRRLLKGLGFVEVVYVFFVEAPFLLVFVCFMLLKFHFLYFLLCVLSIMCII